MHIYLPTVTAIHCNSTLDLHDIVSANNKGSGQIIINYLMDCLLSARMNRKEGNARKKTQR